MTTENKVRKGIMKTLGGRTDVRIFRNNVGVAFQGEVAHESSGFITLEHYRRIRFGLYPGSGDLVGWKTIEITPDMVGKKVAVFTSIETKKKRGRASDNQLHWAHQVSVSGGIAGIVRSTEQAVEIVDGY